MKKLLLSLAITTALTGCGGESLEELKNDTVQVVPASTVAFDPSNGVVSVPNDLLFSGTKDGTLAMPGENATTINYADPQTALGALDGWSTQTPYTIALKFPANVSLDAVSVVTPGSVRIFEVVMGASLVDEECSVVPAGLGCKLVGELTYGVDFATKPVGDSIAIIPLKPFKAGASYINVLTRGVKDSEGRSVEPSSTYALVKQDMVTMPLVTASQKQLQAVINSYENAITSQGTITKDDIIFSGAMTMQSVGTALGTVKKLLAANLQMNPAALPKVAINPDFPSMTVADVFASIGMTDISPVFTAVKYQKGSIVLPIYNKTPQAPGINALAESSWQGLCDNAVIVSGYKALAGDAFPMDPINEADGLCFGLSGGKLRDLGLDPQKHLTKYNSIPKVQRYENAEVQFTTPDSDLTLLNYVRSTQGLPPLEMPEAGWPIVILQHGITRQKEDMLAVTAALSLQGFATVAIDHPLHGTRGLDVNQDGTDDFNASTLSVLHYMNLSSLLVARDNLRQSAADLLALRLGLNFINVPNVNKFDVSYVGQSLGSVVAPMFLTHTNSTLGNPQVDAMFKVNTASLSSGGGGVASFLLESQEFGPFIQASVLSAAGTDETAEFLAFAQAVPANCAVYAQNPEAFATCAYQEFMTSLTQQGESAKIANIQAVFTQFVFAAQTVLDVADSTNYAQGLKATGTPVHISLVVGDGMDNKKDTVIPPYTMNNPLASTIPFAKLAGLAVATETQMTAEPQSYVTKFVKGHHGSLLSPAPRDGAGATAQESARATAEMQLQMATYLASSGRMLVIGDSTLVTE
ncbi:VolA/Pla-1 family phospholipase [Pseudoalteromonas tunicata]|uniref:VolA/Pla-1 family phospholipase n=1 Tax=Pseudoalteromonas tunicata TaxID=314281 RepID=UPI00273F3E59|nr:VolA/Pla-1 family phospholipase [Pseudoalteromonas tunicata]MDP4982147.1 lipase [Pseudoalteromonas tunicata]MDP5211522.1 lipase [Pseudoalteromonas tunicata]